MASTPAPGNKDEEANNSTTSVSHFQKTVCLQDWWLIKAEKDFQGRRIAVAGTTSREQFAVRMFSSAPILKTYDVHILETVDGVCVILKGFINKDRTKENGFSSEVFKHFVFGFPADWERYAEGGLVGQSSIKHTSKMVERSSIEDSANSSLGCDKLSTDEGNVDDLHEATPNRNESTNTLGGYGNNGVMGRGLEKFPARDKQIESSPAIPVVAHVDGLLESSPNRNESGCNSRRTLTESSPATPVVARVDDLHEATPDKNERISNLGGYCNNDKMDQCLENFPAGQILVESSPATPVVEHVDDLHEPASASKDSTCSSGGYGNNDEMDQGLKNFAARQTQTESSPATPVVTRTDEIAYVDDSLKSTPNRNESSSNLGGYGNFDNMDHGLENFPTRQTHTESSPATTVVADVGGLDEATPNKNERIGNTGGYGNNDEMDQGLENVATRRKPIESSPATPVVSHMDALHEATQERTDCTSNSGGCGNIDEMDQGLENFAARQTQAESSPATPIVTHTEMHQVCEEVIGSTMKSPKLPSISEAGNGSNATRNSKRQKTIGSKIPCIHEKIVEASSRCLNNKNKNRSPTRDHEILNGEKRNDAVAAVTATSVTRKNNLEELSCSKERMDVFSFGSSKRNDKVNLVTRGKSKVKSVSRDTPYQLRRAANGDGKSGRRSNFTQPEVGVANTMADKSQEQMSGNKASQASKPRKRTRKILESPIGISAVSQKNKQNVADKETAAKDSGRSKKKTKRELIFESPVVQGKEVDSSSKSASLTFKRSRSGRLLLPTLEFWRNQRAVYDGDREVTAVVGGLNNLRTSSRGTRSEPQRKRGRL